MIKMGSGRFMPGMSPDVMARGGMIKMGGASMGGFGNPMMRGGMPSMGGSGNPMMQGFGKPISLAFSINPTLKAKFDEKSATQSPTYKGYPASNAFKGTFTHTGNKVGEYWKASF